MAAALVTVGTPASARAEPPRLAQKDADLARAKKLFRQADKLFGLGRFQEALVKYEAAYEAKAIPDFMFNIAQCHRNLENYQEAIFSFRRYLSLRPDTNRRTDIEELIEELEILLEEQREDARPIPLVETPAKPAPRATPVYKRWWFWTGIAAVAAGTTAIVLTRDDSGLPDTDLGNLDFGK